LRSITPVARGAHYSPLAIFLHWAVAALILLNWLLPHIAVHLTRSNALSVIALHRSIGVTVLTLVLVRAAWRYRNPPPPLPGGTAQLIRIAAHLSHAALYLLMIAVPILGILYTWAGRRTVSIWGVVDIPPPHWIDPDMHNIFRSLHENGANAILWLVGLHVAAVLLHQYVFKDHLLDRMLPARFRSDRSRDSAMI
jgi:cytochrome b561